MTQPWYRLLSWLCGLGILAFLTWITIAPFGFSAIPLAAVLILGLGLATVRLGVRRPVSYWESPAEPNQVARVALMIVAALGLQLAIGAGLQFAGQMNDVSSKILSIAIWVGVPAISLASGFVAWPERRASPGKLDFAIVAAIALALAATLCVLTASSGDGERATTWSGGLAARIAMVFTAATMEEVVFRVLWLTALVRATNSRTHALILSTTVFALSHAPLVLAQPVLTMDWDLLREASAWYFPGMMWQLGLGFLLGALWLRTGSLALIAIIHALYNLGGLLAGG